MRGGLLAPGPEGGLAAFVIPVSRQPDWEAALDAVRDLPPPLAEMARDAIEMLVGILTAEYHRLRSISEVGDLRVIAVGGLMEDRPVGRSVGVLLDTEALRAAGFIAWDVAPGPPPPQPR